MAGCPTRLSFLTEHQRSFVAGLPERRLRLAYTRSECPTRPSPPQWRPPSWPPSSLLPRVAGRPGVAAPAYRASESGTQAKLTLVCAPAGFGKTTLPAEWMTRNERPVTWLSLDRGDNNPRTWTYLFRALQRCAPEVGASAVATMEAAQLLLHRILLATVLNEVAGLTTELILVFDDYHVVEAGPVHTDMAFLLEHAPPNLHVVVASRNPATRPFHAARSRSARGKSGGRLALHTRRSRPLSQRDNGSSSSPRKTSQRWNRAPEGVDCGVAARGPFHARPGGRRRVHRRVHR